MIIEGGFKQAKQTVDAGGRATLTFNVGPSSQSVFVYSSSSSDAAVLQFVQPSDDEIKFLVYKTLWTSVRIREKNTHGVNFLTLDV